MGKDSAIEWTRHTHNFWIGCSKVSEACKSCYAEVETFARIQRSRGRELCGADAGRHVTAAANWRKPFAWNEAARIAGERHRVFVNSLSDFFEDRDDLALVRKEAWEVIARCRDLDWLLLTKRPENIIGMLPFGWGAGWPHVWIGTTVENQPRADERIPHLVRVPAAVRFLSVEPMLGPVDLTRIDATKAGWRGINGSDGTISAFARWQDTPMRAKLSNGVDWVIVGGESGHGSRPFNLDWARSIVRQCAAADVPCFFKQAGANPVDGSLLDGEAFDGLNHIKLRNKKGGDLSELPGVWPRQFPRGK